VLCLITSAFNAIDFVFDAMGFVCDAIDFVFDAIDSYSMFINITTENARI